MFVFEIRPTVVYLEEDGKIVRVLSCSVDRIFCTLSIVALF